MRLLLRFVIRNRSVVIILLAAVLIGGFYTSSTKAYGADFTLTPTYNTTSNECNHEATTITCIDTNNTTGWPSTLINAKANCSASAFLAQRVSGNGYNFQVSANAGQDATASIVVYKCGKDTYNSYYNFQNTMWYLGGSPLTAPGNIKVMNVIGGTGVKTQLVPANTIPLDGGGYAPGGFWEVVPFTNMGNAENQFFVRVLDLNIKTNVLTSSGNYSVGDIYGFGATPDLSNHTQAIKHGVAAKIKLNYDANATCNLVVPGVIDSGSSFSVRFTVTNTGSLDWDDSFMLKDISGNTPSKDIYPFRLTSGYSTTIDYVFSAPQVTNIGGKSVTYKWRMSNGVTEFGRDCGFTVLVKPQFHNNPYIRATNNDAWSGALFSHSGDMQNLDCSYSVTHPYTKKTVGLANTAQVKTNGIADPTKPLNSSSSDYGIFSTGLNNIDANYPFLGYNGLQNNSINRYNLTFSNYSNPPTPLGYGNFSETALCLPDYYSIYSSAKPDTQTGAKTRLDYITNPVNIGRSSGVPYSTAPALANPWAQLKNISVHLTGNNSLSQLLHYKDAPGTIDDATGDTVPENYGLIVPKNDFVTILVEGGDFTIDRNITYNTVGVFGGENMPSVMVIVKDGNIKITKDVTKLSGIFIAQPGVEDDATYGYTISRLSGNIDTCSDLETAKPYVKDGSVNNGCATQLKMDGSLVAQTFSFNRLYGSIDTDQVVDKSKTCLATTDINNCAAEHDKFDPSAYLSGSYGAIPYIGDAIGQAQSLRNLPPIY